MAVPKCEEISDIRCKSPVTRFHDERDGLALVFASGQAGISFRI
jgi:hypothetical protein